MEDNKGFRLDSYYEDKNVTDLAALDAELGSFEQDSNDFAQGGEISMAEQYAAQNKKPNPAMAGLQGAASGAAAGAAFGPWGAAIGGVIGGAGGVMKGIAGGKAYDAELSEATTGDNLNAKQEVGSTGLGSTDGGSQVGFQAEYADGGELFNPIDPQGPNVFNTGGTHEANPHGGIPLGQGNNGKQNSVEEGEVMFKYGGKTIIISNRLG